MFDLISEAAATLRIDRSAAAQLVAAVAALLISIAATFVSVVAARATARSVKEMRAARVQSSRPVLEFPPNTQYIFRWDRKRNHPDFYTQDGEEWSPSIEVANIGAGPAMNINFWNEEPPNKAGHAPVVENLRRLFGATDISVYTANNGFEFHDRRFADKNPVRMFSNILDTMSHIKTCAIGDRKNVLINRHLVEGFVLRSLSEFQDGHFSWFVPCCLSYKGISDEVVYERYYLVMLSDGVQFRLGEPVAEFDGVISWDQIEINISFYISERAVEPSLARQLSAKYTKWLQSRLKPFSSARAKAVEWTRNWILYGGRPTHRFQIGDRVVFKAAADWKVIVDGGEELRASPQAIDPNKWTQVESTEHSPGSGISAPEVAPLSDSDVSEGDRSTKTR